jgi:hypothetical protein
MRLPQATLAVLVGLTAACTALIAEEPVQCFTDSDCLARGPDFASSICAPSGLCEARPGPVPECTKSSECAARGANLACSSSLHKCVPLTSDDCSVVYGDALADGAVLFGLLSEISPSDPGYFRDREHVSAAKLAFTEFFEKAGIRFPGGRGGALVACSEQAPRRATAHLANLGVEVVIGPSSEARQRAVVETLLPARIPSFSGWIAGSPAAVIPESAGFAWLTGFQRGDVIPPLNALLAERESKLKVDSGGVIPHVRVAVIVNATSPSAFNPFAGYAEILDQRLSFNGRTAIENERDATCGNCYKRFTTNPATPAEIEQRANDILAFNPHFILPFTDLDFGTQLLPKLEEKYATAISSVNRPIYLQPFVRFEETGYKALPVANATIRGRIGGILPTRNNTFEIFQNRYREAFRPPSAPDKLGPAPSANAGRAFETSLLLLLSTYAALVANPDAAPEDVVAALPRVTDRGSTTKITLDPSLAVQRLNAKESIDLDGLFTTFDFDAKANSAPATWTTWCVATSGQYISGKRIFDGQGFGPMTPCE